jgi:hypothetical protein
MADKRAVNVTTVKAGDKRSKAAKDIAAMRLREETIAAGAAQVIPVQGWQNGCWPTRWRRGGECRILAGRRGAPPGEAQRPGPTPATPGASKGGGRRSPWWRRLGRDPGSIGCPSGRWIETLTDLRRRDCTHADYSP